MFIRVLCETIKEFITKMGSLHSSAEGETAVQAQAQSGETTESIGHKCRILNEKLDQLLNTLHEEAPPTTSSPRTSIDEGDLQLSQETEQIAIADEMTKSTKEAKESRNESRAVRQKGVRKRAKFSQREALMSRANSLKKAVRQIIEHAEKALDEQNGARTARSTRSPSTATGGSDFKLIVTHQPDDHEMVDENKRMSSTETLGGMKSSSGAAIMPMALLQLYSAIGSGDSSSEPSPCPSPLPVMPSLTTNFPILPTSPIRYPNPPVFFRMATPPQMQPQRPSGSSPRPPIAQQESPESEGDEDRSAVLSLQVLFIFFCFQSCVKSLTKIFPFFFIVLQTKLNAISPVPDTSETGTSCEFNFSGLALPVPLEFADTDSLQDVPIDVFDEDPESRDQLTSNFYFYSYFDCFFFLFI